MIPWGDCLCVLDCGSNLDWVVCKMNWRLFAWCCLVPIVTSSRLLRDTCVHPWSLHVPPVQPSIGHLQAPVVLLGSSTGGVSCLLAVPLATRGRAAAVSLLVLAAPALDLMSKYYFPAAATPFLRRSSNNLFFHIGSTGLELEVQILFPCCCYAFSLKII